MWAESRERGGHLGYDLIIWHLALWVHSHVQHLGLQPSGSLAALLPECLNWKSIHLLFSYWSVAAVYSSSLSAAEYCHWSGTAQEATWQASTVLCEPPLINSLYFSTCVATKLHTQREQSAIIRLRQHILALAVGCSAMLQCTLSAEGLGVISCHLRERYRDSLSVMRP